MNGEEDDDEEEEDEDADVDGDVEVERWRWLGESNDSFEETLGERSDSLKIMCLRLSLSTSELFRGGVKEPFEGNKWAVCSPLGEFFIDKANSFSLIRSLIVDGIVDGVMESPIIVEEWGVEAGESTKSSSLSKGKQGTGLPIFSG